jgi:SAM-dependent methyltransferase
VPPGRAKRERTLRRSHFYVEIFLVSFAALLLEISYTRVFSFKASSHYTYLIIGLALLGIGGGGVFVALASRLREISTERLLHVLSLVAAGAIALGYLGVVGVEIDTQQAPSSPGQLLRLAWICLLLFAAFLGIGLVIAVIFTRRSEVIHRVYAADLAGAAAGCAAAVPLMMTVTPPGCVFAAASAVALAGLRPGRAVAPGRSVASLVLAAGLAIVVALPAALPDPAVAPIKTLSERQRDRWGFEPVFSRWHPVFRVDVLESALMPDQKALAHDGDWGSALHRFDGDLEAVRSRYEGSSRRLPFAVAPAKPRVLIIGSAGGNEILASLVFDAESVTAVELNPVTVSLVREHFADFTGRLPEQPEVTLVNAEGRSFLSRDEQKYDLIYFVAPDSYAAMNAAQASGFVMVESYLYTREMVREALAHLRPGGILCMQFGEVAYDLKPNRTARFLATARSVFRDLGLDPFGRHVLHATNRDFPIVLSTVLLSAEPFSEPQIDAFLGAVEEIPTGAARHAWRRGLGDGVANAVIGFPEPKLQALFRSYPYLITPVSDDAPFFWHFARFRDVLSGDNPALANPVGPEDGRGEATLLAMLFVATGLSAVFLLTPFVGVRRRWAQLPAKGWSMVYFAALGLGFMFFEIALIQKFTLFLGYPTYTLTVTLFSLLVFSGLGSLATGRYREARDRALPVLVAAVAGLAVFYGYGMDPAAAALAGLPLGARAAVAALALAPLGLVLGAFMPLGLTTVARLSEYDTEYVAWGWAVNGVFSVMGSIGATVLSMTFGFRAVLWLALALYLLAAMMLRRVPLLSPGRDAGV